MPRPGQLAPHLRAVRVPWLRAGSTPRAVVAVRSDFDRRSFATFPTPPASALRPATRSPRPASSHGLAPRVGFERGGSGRAGGEGDAGGSSKDTRGDNMRIAFSVGCTAVGVAYLGRISRQGNGAVVALAEDLAPPHGEEGADVLRLWAQEDQPFHTRSWIWRVLFTVRRIVRLCAIFAPLVGATLVMLLLGVSEWEGSRAWYLTLLVSCVEQGGCCWMKLGQWASMRPDLFSPEVIQALATLRNQAPQHSEAHTRAMVRVAFGREVEDVFEAFTAEPCASGSVAQVHRARLRESFLEERGLEGLDFRDVAVKVLHPDVDSNMFVDLAVVFETVDFLARLLQGVSGTRIKVPFDRAEADLRIEAHNLARFARNFAGDEGVVFPRVALADRRVLVETWLEGATLDQLFSRV
ncbi:ABC1 family-domain-containing protein, partial [Baffinella frigidus]